jgi:predicted  nucleic acid-binding Zn ribbon protein
VIWWQSNYQACDTLNMDCGFGERFGERQMSEFNSGLKKQGRRICAEIKQLTGKPVYYYLHRHHGKTGQTEIECSCPSCGGAWKLPETLHQLYDFKCDECCLLSNVAWSVRNP